MKAEKFNKKFDLWILPLFIFLVSLFSLSSIYNLTLNLEDLIQIDGTIRNIRIEPEKGVRGRINYNLYIYLTEGSRFKIMDDEIFKPYRNDIQKTIQRGDDVTIYKRTELQTKLGMGTANLIYQLNHNGEVLFPINLMHRNFKRLLIFELIILSGLTIAQIIRKRRRASNIKNTL